MTVANLPLAAAPAPTSGLGSFFNDAFAIGGEVLAGLGEFELAKFQIKQQTAMQALQQSQERAAEQARSPAAAQVSSNQWIKPVAIGGAVILVSLVALKAFKVI